MTEPESLRIGLVAHHAFCPRRAWLEIHGEETDTAQVAQGVADHAAVDEVSTSRPVRRRAFELQSARLGLVGRCDTVETAEDGGLTVVEHKAAPVRRSSEVTFPQQIQLALQASCLRDQGHEVTGAAIWFSTTRRRVEVPLNDELITVAEQHARSTRVVVDGSAPPAPLEDDARCRRCSHVAVCLPDEHRQRSPARRIGIADPTGRVLHLATPGSRASLSRGQIKISVRDEEPVVVPLEQTSGLVVHGNADVSAALLRETLERGYPIVWCAWSGRVVGWANSARAPNLGARSLQHRFDDGSRLAVARSMIEAKIRNQVLMLRRHGHPARDELRQLASQAALAESPVALFGAEGQAAKIYFAALSEAFRPAWATFDSRSGRPAKDPVNAALNVAYGLLLADVLRSVVACGLDPAGGVLHSAGRNKPALALDLMEEFRAPLADAAVVWAINNGELKQSDFRRDPDAVRLSQRGRKSMIAAYERRVTSEFNHPVFGYRVTWRRAMEVQARMILAVVLDELPAYRAIALR